MTNIYNTKKKMRFCCHTHHQCAQFVCVDFHPAVFKPLRWGLHFFTLNITIRWPPLFCLPEKYFFLHNSTTVALHRIKKKKLVLQKKYLYERTYCLAIKCFFNRIKSCAAAAERGPSHLY